MASFVQFLQDSGVYAAQSFMIVPRGGFNLVCLRDSKDVGLSYDRHRLEVEDVRLEHVERVAQEYINTRFRAQRSQERQDQLLRLRTALYATARRRALRAPSRSRPKVSVFRNSEPCAATHASGWRSPFCRPKTS